MYKKGFLYCFKCIILIQQKTCAQQLWDNGRLLTAKIWDIL